MFFYATKLYGRRAFTARLYEGTLPDYTAEALAGASNIFVGVGTKLYGGRLLLQDCTRYFTRQRGGGPGVEASNLVGERLGGFCHPHSLTTRLHGGRDKTTNSSDAGCRFLLHTLHKSRDPLIA